MVLPNLGLFGERFSLLFFTYFSTGSVKTGGQTPRSPSQWRRVAQRGIYAQPFPLKFAGQSSRRLLWQIDRRLVGSLPLPWYPGLILLLSATLKSRMRVFSTWAPRLPICLPTVSSSQPGGPDWEDRILNAGHSSYTDLPTASLTLSSTTALRQHRALLFV